MTYSLPVGHYPLLSTDTNAACPEMFASGVCVIGGAGYDPVQEQCAYLDAVDLTILEPMPTAMIAGVSIEP